MNIECPQGHVYKDLGELPAWWPDGAPICPICCKNWIYTHPGWDYVKKLKTMARIRKRLEDSHGGKKTKIEFRLSLPDMR
jgi:hypothetical protein